jgi:hypothetical protein
MRRFAFRRTRHALVFIAAGLVAQGTLTAASAQVPRPASQRDEATTLRQRLLAFALPQEMLDKLVGIFDPKATQLTDACGADVADRMREAWAKAVTTRVDAKRLGELISKQFAEVVAVEDLPQAIAFWESPLGQKYFLVQSVFMAATQAEMTERTLRTAEELGSKPLRGRLIDQFLRDLRAQDDLMAMLDGVDAGIAAGILAVPQRKDQLLDVDAVKAALTTQRAMRSESLRSLNRLTTATMLRALSDAELRAPSDAELRALTTALSTPAALRVSRALSTALTSALAAQAFDVGTTFTKAMQEEAL